MQRIAARPLRRPSGWRSAGRRSTVSPRASRSRRFSTRCSPPATSTSRRPSRRSGGDLTHHRPSFVRGCQFVQARRNIPAQGARKAVSQGSGPAAGGRRARSRVAGPIEPKDRDARRRDDRSSERRRKNSRRPPRQPAAQRPCCTHRVAGRRRRDARGRARARERRGASAGSAGARGIGFGDR